MLTFCLIGSQPAAIGQPTSHVTKYQPVRLLVGQMVAGGQGAWPHWAQSSIPALPLAPLGEWPTWPRPGRQHKWALQPIIYHWHYFQGPFAVLYLCHLITYSCMKCREMLYRLFSLQTNLLISFTINLMYDYTKVLLLRNYFYHHKSEMLLKSLTKGWPGWSSNTLGHEMSLPGGVGC